MAGRRGDQTEDETTPFDQDEVEVVVLRALEIARGKDHPETAKARQKLGWTPKVDFKALVEMMVDADVERLAATPSPRPVARRS